jgi:hypothetical protein
MFGRSLFLGIVIPIGIPIPLRRGIPIPLKNERNSYSNGNRLDFLEKNTIFFFFKKKKKKKTKPQPPLNSGWPTTQWGGRPSTYGAIWGWPKVPRGWSWPPPEATLRWLRPPPGYFVGGGRLPYSFQKKKKIYIYIYISILCGFFF